MNTLLNNLRQLVEDEQDAAHARLFETWESPLAEKLRKGITQGFNKLEKGPESGTLWVYPDESESRFREGDLLCLHQGQALEPLCRQVAFEYEEDDRWLIRSTHSETAWQDYQGGSCYADPDTLDLTGYYKQTLDDIATSAIGQDIVLPMLMGELELTFDENDMDQATCIARSEDFNAMQAEAVSWAHGAHHVACIQGPPGTGKTRVLGLIARMAVERGERILVTSHTHTAINNALNAIAKHHVPLIKIGRSTQCKGLDQNIAHVENFDDWDDRPTQPGQGYVIGATPFATCSARLAHTSFDTVIFDEASQITLTLALMAMRKAKRYIFIGDQQQLPPVLLTRSILDGQSHSVFARLTSNEADHLIMLNQTYRMNQWLAAWPSQTYYGGHLHAAGPNAQRQLQLRNMSDAWGPVLAADAPAVFIPNQDNHARSVNQQEAQWVAQLCHALIEAGLSSKDIGIVSPFRAQGRAIRTQLKRHLHPAQASALIADTVERMQGQEREVVILSLASGDRAFISMTAPFLFQPERINVSITRAKTKLIIMGPETIDPNDTDNPTLQQWMQQYQSLISQCKKVLL
ncbi:DEAD/DEAH box helicase [Lampropedia puyangensis]|nr:AAA domain-containing protein [Lampropedia puyangensis]